MRKLLALGYGLVALSLVGCAATPEEPGDEETEGSTESAIVSGGGAACPIDGRESQGFSRAHDGLDLANKLGTPIFAVMGGTVTASGPAQGYGQWIRIQHADGSMTEYGHMSKRLVQVGAKVRAGQQIAAVGSEGESTGPHLHLRAYRSALKNGAGNGMNPIDYLKARGISIPCKPNGTVAPPPSATVAGDGNDGASDGTITVWKATKVYASPELGAAVVASAPPDTYDAECWTEGDTVTSSGYSHDKWVKVDVNGKTGYVSGIFLKGDETGGITEQCQ